MRRINTGIVIAGQQGAGGSQGAGTPSTEDYLGRLVKYIPAEAIALYLAGIRIVGDQSHDAVGWGIFAACLLLTPFYLAGATRDPAQGKGPLWEQVALATIAFPVWAFNVGGGPFDRWQHAPTDLHAVGALALLFVTAIFGLIKPAPGS
ncbi:MAG: hypothetical protein M3167_00225 [Acidobacteriota bacterium]|nr:hypothetical protein [Acidobacteriota bacterium]